MAIFQHQNKQISYQIDDQETFEDLLFLQGSLDWAPILREMKKQSMEGPGRVVVLEKVEADELLLFVKALGLSEVHVIASGVGATVAAKALQLEPGTIAKVTLFDEPREITELENGLPPGRLRRLSGRDPTLMANLILHPPMN